ncbi:LuxR family transcriptional regulator [Streptomyces sp. HPF1205]|uniref:helix-turn-helix transcriptional regulator n=1 Tax=Streptomyces sp. HPF1205 TaxID=2873262 RepID=UPI001CEC923A|nr:LuxR family transcriptional regulator [Streptomyces sp. HPF1205]
MALGFPAYADDAEFARLTGPPGPPVELYGRRREWVLLDGLLEGAGGGRSAAVVVRGGAGVGKTALVEHALVEHALRAAAQEFAVVRAAGVRAERDVGYAALHQLCGPLLPRLDRLPGPERGALGIVLGLRAGPAPDRLAVGAAVPALLSAAAGDGLVCVIDDAQWLDRPSAQALAFAARRLRPGPVLMVIVTREQRLEFHGLPELVVGGLPDADARGLLDALVRRPLDALVRERFLAEARGNPLALLELSRGLTAELASGYQTPGTPPPGPHEAEPGLQRRVAYLPEPSRRLLLLAAADPTGDAALVWRAAARLGITPDAAVPVAEAGLLTFGAMVRFEHPAIRSAVYGAAPLAVRQEIHRALAEATDRRSAPDRRAWHRALATSGPDDEVAAELEHAAGRARADGNLVAAAVLLERAATLTPDPVRRVERALAAAQYTILTGAHARARRLLALAEAGSAGPSQRARARRLRARLAPASECGGDTPLVLLKAARQVEESDSGLARATYLDALTAAMAAGRLAGEGWSAAEVSRAARGAPRPADPSASDLLLDGLTGHVTHGYAAGAPLLRKALDAFGRGMPLEEELPRLWPACLAAMHLWDDRAWDALSLRYVTLARGAGALGELRPALGMRSLALLLSGGAGGSGGSGAAAGGREQATAEPEDGGFPSYGALGRLALRAEEDRALALIGAMGEYAVTAGQGTVITFTKWAEAVLCNGIGSYDRALAAAREGDAYPHEVGVSSWLLAESVEAAARSGAPGRAASALARLSEAARAGGTDWALGVEARSRALLSEGDTAERLFREAVDRLGRTRVRVELARAHLLYGEWLRREGRRTHAREQLRLSHEMLTAMGAEGFAERARRELLATGETVRKRTPDTATQLTAQEAQIAGLACDGLSNPEISVRLFISPRTVEWHLGKVFTKLGITSRKQLRTALQTAARPGRPHRRVLRAAAPSASGPGVRHGSPQFPPTVRPA